MPKQTEQEMSPNVVTPSDTVFVVLHIRQDRALHSKTYGPFPTADAATTAAQQWNDLNKHRRGTVMHARVAPVTGGVEEFMEQLSTYARWLSNDDT